MIPPYFVDNGFHIPKLQLLEVWPLRPFLRMEQPITVLDVGANVGLWCAAFMRTFGTDVGAYIGFEPLDGNRRIFTGRLRDGEIPNGNKVGLHDCCVGDAPGQITLHFNTTSEVSSIASVVLDTVKIGAKTIANNLTKVCTQVTIDDFCHTQGIEKVDLVKIDVEGYEMNVLKGASRLIASGGLRNIYFEFGEHQGSIGQSFKQFWDLLRGAGYQIYRQNVSRNFFGVQHISEYHPSLEQFNSMWMILATKEPMQANLNAPMVVGRWRPTEPKGN